jgi:hypothetical protein
MDHGRGCMQENTPADFDAVVPMQSGVGGSEAAEMEFSGVRAPLAALPPPSLAGGHPAVQNQAESPGSSGQSAGRVQPAVTVPAEPTGPAAPPAPTGPRRQNLAGSSGQSSSSPASRAGPSSSATRAGPSSRSCHACKHSLAETDAVEDGSKYYHRECVKGMCSCCERVVHSHETDRVTEDTLHYHAECVRGVCPACAKIVHCNSLGRIKAGTQYYHLECTRGSCSECAGTVFEDQDRTRNPDGSYRHTRCPE